MRCNMITLQYMSTAVNSVCGRAANDNLWGDNSHNI